MVELSFVCFALSVGLWSVFYFFWQIAGSEEDAISLTRILMGAAAFIPISFFYFTTTFRGYSHKYQMVSGVVISFCFAIVSISTSGIVAGVSPKMGVEYWPDAGPLLKYYLLFWFYYVVGSIVVLSRDFRRQHENKKNQIKYILIGTVIGFTGGATNFFLWYDIPIPPIGNVLVSFYVFGVSYATARYRLMDVDLALVKGAAFFFVVALVALAYPVSWILIDSGGAGGRQAEIFVKQYLVSFVLVGFLFLAAPRFMKRLNAFVETQLKQSQYNYRNQLRWLIRKIDQLERSEEIFSKTATFLCDQLSVEAVAVFIREKTAMSFVLRARAGAKDFEIRALDEQDSLVEVMNKVGGVICVEELRQHIDAGGDGSLPIESGVRKLSELGVEILIPLLTEERLHGFFLLGKRWPRNYYSEPDLALFEVLGMEIAASIRIRELERRSAENEKLMALGTMAAGLAHELRNPMVSVQTYISMLEDECAGPVLIKDTKMLGIIQRDLRRMNEIVHNVGAFAQNVPLEMNPVDLRSVVDTAIEVEAENIQRRDVRTTVHCQVTHPVRGDFNQLVQVFQNLIMNATQAFQENHEKLITITAVEKLENNGRGVVLVTVEDTGPGIDMEIIRNLFEPFVTTKATGSVSEHRGMGLGLAIVKQIIESHQGIVEAFNRPSGGSLFRILLPLMQGVQVHGQNGNERLSIHQQHD